MMERVFQQMSKRNAAAIGTSGAGSGGSIVKLLRSDLARLGRDVALEVLGPYGMVMDSDVSGGTLQHFALTSPYTSIAGGTDEIQVSQIARSLLAG